MHVFANPVTYELHNIEPITTTTTVVSFGIFSQIPHSGISLRIYVTGISGDADFNFSNNDIQGKIVIYTYTTNHPSTKMIKAQITFCDIAFCSLPLTISIKERSG